MNEILIIKAQAFDLMAAEQQKSVVMQQLLQQIAVKLKVNHIQEIMPALQKLVPE